MKYAFITSMNLDYYHHCGELMLASFQKKSKHPLFVYNEDFNPKVKDSVTLMYWNLGKQYDEFQERWRHNKKVTTFAKKAFSIIHAMENIDADRIIWLDADTQLTKDIHPQLLEFISSDDVLSTHFGVTHERDDRKYFSCETGFFILNKTHRKFNEFKNTYKQIYCNDDYTSLRRFYDGEVYGETVQRLANKGAKMLELNPGLIHKTPIPRSILDPYITHFKAGVKDNIDFDKKVKELNDSDEV